MDSKRKRLKRAAKRNLTLKEYKNPSHQTDFFLKKERDQEVLCLILHRTNRIIFSTHYLPLLIKISNQIMGTLAEK